MVSANLPVVSVEGDFWSPGCILLITSLQTLKEIYITCSYNGTYVL